MCWEILIVVKMSIILKRWNQILMKYWWLYDMVNPWVVEIDNYDYVNDVM